MGTHTSIWCWSQMLPGQGTSIVCPSKGRGPGGNAYPEIGAKIGKVTPTSMVKASHSKSPLAIKGQLLATMSHRGVGSSDRHSKGDSSKSILAFKISTNMHLRRAIYINVIKSSRVEICFGYGKNYEGAMDVVASLHPLKLCFMCNIGFLKNS